MDFESLYQNPGDPDWLLRYDERKKFRTWCKKNDKSFAAWLDRARAECGKGPHRWWKKRSNLEADWHPGGWKGYYRDRMDRALVLMRELSDLGFEVELREKEE